MVLTRVVLPLLLALAVIGKPLVSANAPGIWNDTRCSLIVYPLNSISTPDEVYLLGTATRDSVIVPRSMFETRGADEQLRNQPLRGQVIGVDTVGGPAAGVLRNAFAKRGSHDVVVVPWDYSPDCSAIPWGRSTLFLAPGLEAFFTLRLRPDSLWVNGRPTLDAFRTDMSFYPQGGLFQRKLESSFPTGNLTARELFELRTLLPDPWMSARDAATSARLNAWVARDPQRAKKYPAAEVVRALRPSR